jgi:hypothetical protein
VIQHSAIQYSVIQHYAIRIAHGFRSGTRAGRPVSLSAVTRQVAGTVTGDLAFPGQGGILEGDMPIAGQILRYVA